LWSSANTKETLPELEVRVPRAAAVVKLKGFDTEAWASQLMKKKLSSNNTNMSPRNSIPIDVNS